jgi:hypothetical protein
MLGPHADGHLLAHARAQCERERAVDRPLRAGDAHAAAALADRAVEEVHRRAAEEARDERFRRRS